MMRCKCGHTRQEHKGIITDWFGRNVSNDACLAGTRFIQANSAYGERIGGDRCEHFRLSIRRTFIAPAAPKDADTERTDR